MSVTTVKNAIKIDRTLPPQEVILAKNFAEREITTEILSRNLNALKAKKKPYTLPKAP